METFFLYTYPLVGLISLAAFIPQISALIKSTTSSANVSVKSWFLWTVTSVVSFGYGVYVLNDIMFCIMMGVTMFLNMIVISLIIYKRYVVFGYCRNVFDVVLEYFFRYPYFGVCTTKIKVN